MRLLAQQDEPVAVTWADLSRAHVSWDDFLQLVPLRVVAKSVSKVGSKTAPEPTHIVPRKLLELLRSQLDVLAAQWSASDAAASQQAELNAQAAVWATSLLDQAKRITDRKRIPEVAAEAVRDAQKLAVPGGEER